MNGNTVKLLLADDSAIVRGAICALLRDQTDIAVCGEVGNYADLFKMLNECAPDIVLMDLRMPGEDRFDPAAIKDQLHVSRLLAMSFANDQETASLAKEYGALKLLDKMQLASTLLPAIEECMQQSRTVHHG